MQCQTCGCILLDLKMPGRGGHRLYHFMAETDPRLAGQIIFMTGDNFSPDTPGFILANGNPALGKPFSVEELRQRILKSLEAKLDSR